MSLIIDSRAHTRQAIEADIIDYLGTLPDYERFKDLFESSVGKRLLDMMSGIAELLIYKMDVRARENYLYTAMAQPSIYLLADMFGYNTNRRSAAQGEVTITFEEPLSSAVTITDGYQVAEGNKPLVVQGSHEISAGSTTATVPVAQGEYKYKLLTTTPAKDFFFNGEVIETVEVQALSFERIVITEDGFGIDNAETEKGRIQMWNCLADTDGNLTATEDVFWYNNIAELDTDSVYLRTYYLGGISLQFGDNQFGKKLETNDLILLRYLNTNGRSALVAKGTDVGEVLLPTTTGTAIGKVTVSEVVTGGNDEDDVAKVRTVVAGYFSSQARAVTINDWISVIMSYEGVINAQVRRDENECCTVNVVSLTQNMAIEDSYDWTNPNEYWNSVREGALISFLEGYKMITTQVIVYDPEPEDIGIAVEVTLSFGVIDLQELTNEIKDVVKSYCYRMGIEFHPIEIVEKAVQLSDKIVRVDLAQVTMNGAEQDDPYDVIFMDWGHYLRVRDTEIAVNFTQ